MVRRKNFAKLHLVLKTVPNAVNDAKFFVKFYCAVYRGAVNIGGELSGKRPDAEWSVGGELVKNCHTRFGGAVFCSF